jgi:alkylation response protein AidB-like acyl-CoA dehydrogenase
MLTDSLISIRNLEFLLWEWLNLESLFQRPRFAAHTRADLSAMLDVAHELSRRELAPYSRATDRHEPTMDEHGQVKVLTQSAHAVRSMADAGFFSTVFDEARGGLQLPNTFHMGTFALLMAGNMGTASYVLLTTGNARLLNNFGTDAQIAAFADPQISGQTMGTMCLSESHAGSSLAEIRTRATPDGTDRLGARYRISGDKMWISGGDQDITDNIVHLVLAKVPDPDGKPIPGTRGISLFVVPKILPDGVRNDVSVTGLNHKMGQRALPNCALNFGAGRERPYGSAGAIGWLVGQVGQGLPQMFQMMNDARVAVGLSGAALAARGYQMSLAYAKQRVQGRGPDGGQVAIIEHPDVKRMLLAQKAIAEGAMALALYTARLLDEEQTAHMEADRNTASVLLGLMTPIAKSWPSEWAQEALHQALQIFGGAGYTRDFEIEMLYRDNRLNPIHEGTTGVHGIDLVSRKIRRDKGAAFNLLREKVNDTLARAGRQPALSVGAHAVAEAFEQLNTSVNLLSAEPEERRTWANATAFLNALGHSVVGWLWLDQAVTCDQRIAGGATGDDLSFYSGKIRALNYFTEAELPRVRLWAEQVNSMSSVAASMPIEEF